MIKRPKMNMMFNSSTLAKNPNNSYNNLKDIPETVHNSSFKSNKDTKNYSFDRKVQKRNLAATQSDLNMVNLQNSRIRFYKQYKGIFV